MSTLISPEIELIYSQLLWIERRRSRIVESVGSHFGRDSVRRILQTAELQHSPLTGEPEFRALLDERDPEDFLLHLSRQVEQHEAATIHALRKHVSVYRQHVDEQVLFGARTSGQEAGREFLSRHSHIRAIGGPLEVPEAVQAIFEMQFNGLPGEKNHFLCLRARGAATVHYVRSPHLSAWLEAAAEPRFLFDVRCEWVRGILDILAPTVEFSSAQAIEQGAPFGLEHFFVRGQHAGP